MVKVSAPCMSMQASGSIGGALTFSTWKGRAYARSLVKPKNPKTPGQVGVRAMMKFLSQIWASIKIAHDADWTDLAAATNVSTFNAFIARNMARWRNFQMPINDPEAVDGGQMGTVTIEATAGERSITLTVTPAKDEDIWAVIIYRADTGGFTPNWSNCLLITPAATDAVLTLTDSPLEPGTYYYSAMLIGPDGSKSVAAIEDSATVI